MTFLILVFDLLTKCCIPNVLSVFCDQDNFSVLWNVPSILCLQHNVVLEPENYGITINPNGDFIGDKVTIFYDLGQFSRVDKQGTMINGGVPQVRLIKYTLLITRTYSGYP